MNYEYMTDVGLVREINEDTVFSDIQEEMGIFVVADGMGGLDYGYTASRIAAKTFKEWWEIHQPELKNGRLKRLIIKKLLERGMEYANQAILEYSKNEGKQMGTTLSVLLIMEKKYYIAHIGDSRIYQIYKDKIHLLTEDHTKVNDDYQKGLITFNEFKNSDEKHILIKCLGVEEEITPQIDSGDIKGNELFFLCSDGVHNYLNHIEITKYLKRGLMTDHRKSLRKIGDHILEQGADDNFTAVVVDMK